MLIGLLLLALYVIAFIVRNDEQITIHFILFSAKISLIWEIVFVFALGLLGGVLLSQFSRRQRRARGLSHHDVQQGAKIVGGHVM